MYFRNVRGFDICGTGSLGFARFVPRIWQPRYQRRAGLGEADAISLNNNNNSYYFCVLPYIFERIIVKVIGVLFRV